MEDADQAGQQPIFEAAMTNKQTAVRKWWSNGGRYTILLSAAGLVISVWIAYTVFGIAEDLRGDTPVTLESVAVEPAQPGELMTTTTVLCNSTGEPITVFMSFSLVNATREDVSLTPSATRTAPSGCTTIDVRKTIPANVTPDTYQLTVSVFSRGVQQSTSGISEPFVITGE
jgi:hypothetical protein